MILQSHPSDAAAWLVLAGPTCVLSLPSSDAERLDGLAARLAGPEAFRAALELLVGGGIAAAPSFALIDGDRRVLRVVLRGEAAVTVTPADSDAAELTVSGAGMSTWAERVFEGVRTLGLQVPGSAWTLELEPVLESVPVSDLDTASADAAAPSPSPAPSPVPAPSPLPSAPPVAPVASAAEPAEPQLVAAETTLAPHAGIAPMPPRGALAPTPVAPTAPEPYDFLFGDTIYRTQAGAAIRIPNPDPERPGDHDGHTMLAEDLDLHSHVPETPPAIAADSPSEATVLAPVSGGAAPRPMPPAPQTQTAPTFQLERADGSREALGRPLIIGRAPSASATAPGPGPRFVTIDDDKDISRSHVRIAVEGDAVVVTDLNSRNGTVVTPPGTAPRKLRGSEPTVVLPGTLIDLGGGVAFTVRED